MMSLYAHYFEYGKLAPGAQKVQGGTKSAPVPASSAASGMDSRFDSDPGALTTEAWGACGKERRGDGRADGRQGRFHVLTSPGPLARTVIGGDACPTWAAGDNGSTPVLHTGGQGSIPWRSTTGESFNGRTRGCYPRDGGSNPPLPATDSDGITWEDFAVFARAIRIASDFDHAMKQVARLVGKP